MGARKNKLPVVLTEEERDQLESLARRRKTHQALALRAKIVLRCADGKSHLEIADHLNVSNVTVGKWRKRFVNKRLDGLFDEPRPGQPRKISDADVERVVTKTLEEKPKNATHWSTRSMAKAVGLNATAIQRIWKAFGLQPHREDTFKLSEDPLFIDKVRDVVGLYINPPERALVLCVDEKSQCQALDRSQPLLPMQPGQPERKTHDYYRHGTTSLFAALDVATGKVIGKCQRRHRQKEFLSFLRHLEKNLEVEPGTQIHIVMDNYATHKTESVKRWFQRRPHYHVHFTPTSASWLNQVERFFAEITNKRLRRGVFKSLQALETAIRDYLEEHNENAKPFQWTATADSILQRVANVAMKMKRTNESGH